jgi:hypothetical protein
MAQRGNKKETTGEETVIDYKNNNFDNLFLS